MKQFKKFVPPDISDVLPIGVNEKALEYAKQFQDAELMAAIKVIEKQRGHGELNHNDSKGVPVAIFSFTDGVCTKVNPITWFSARNVFKGSKLFYR